MKLLLDQGLPRSTVAHLASLGIDAIHVGELGLQASADADVLHAAAARNAVVVTLDADFHRLLALSRSANPSVIRLRVEGLKGAELAGLLAHVVVTTGEDLAVGAAVSVTANRIRVRRLPIGH